MLRYQLIDEFVEAKIEESLNFSIDHVYNRMIEILVDQIYLLEDDESALLLLNEIIHDYVPFGDKLLLKDKIDSSLFKLYNNQIYLPAVEKFTQLLVQLEFKYDGLYGGY